MATIHGEPFTQQEFINLLIQLGHTYYEKQQEQTPERSEQDEQLN